MARWGRRSRVSCDFCEELYQLASATLLSNPRATLPMKRAVKEESRTLEKTCQYLDLVMPRTRFTSAKSSLAIREWGNGSRHTTNNRSRVALHRRGSAVA